MKTNFEKWKQNLEPEHLVSVDNGKRWALWDIDGSDCEHCPANKFCESQDVSKFCGDVFLEWANTEEK